jgi:hypothetical protein
VKIFAKTRNDLEILNLVLYKGILREDGVFHCGSQLTIMIQRRQIDRNPDPTIKNDDEKYYVMSLLVIHNVTGKEIWERNCNIPFLGITKIESKEKKLIISHNGGHINIPIQDLYLELTDISEPIPKIKHTK